MILKGIELLILGISSPPGAGWWQFSLPDVLVSLGNSLAIDREGNVIPAILLVTGVACVLCGSYFFLSPKRAWLAAVGLQSLILSVAIGAYWRDTPAYAYVLMLSSSLLVFYFNLPSVRALVGAKEDQTAIR
jgi:hypothetical protein